MQMVAIGATCVHKVIAINRVKLLALTQCGQVFDLASDLVRDGLRSASRTCLCAAIARSGGRRRRYGVPGGAADDNPHSGALARRGLQMAR